MGKAHQSQTLTCKCLLCGTVWCGNVADQSPAIPLEMRISILPDRGSRVTAALPALVLFKPVNTKQPILVAYIARRTGVEKGAVAETVESPKSTGLAFPGCRGGCPFSLMAQFHQTGFGLTLLHVLYSTVRRAQFYLLCPEWFPTKQDALPHQLHGANSKTAPTMQSHMFGREEEWWEVNSNF